MEEESGKRSIMRMDDRLPLVEKVLREANRPLSGVEICKVLGWTTEGDRSALRRIFQRYPDRYLPTKGQKRNESYTLLPKEAESGVRGAVASASVVVTPPPAASPRPADTEADLRTTLTRIRAVVKEVEASTFEPSRVIFALGLIGGIADEALSGL